MATENQNGNGRLTEVVTKLAADLDELNESIRKVVGTQDKLSLAHDKLSLAQAHLVEAQAMFVQSQAILQAQMAEYARESAKTQLENAQRFNRMEAMLIECTRTVERYTEAVRGKIGF